MKDESKTNLIEVSQPAKKPKLEKPDPLIKKNSSSKTRSKQTTLQFEKVEKIKNFKQFETSEQDVESSQKLSKRTTVECNKINCSKFEVNSSTDRQTRVKKLSQPKELLQCKSAQ